MDPADRMQETWERGSYDEYAVHYLPIAGHIVAAAAVTDGDEVLDIGCGTGNVAITAARQGASVTGLDIAPQMLEQATTNADVAAVDGIAWRQGEATDLPVEDDAVDVTLSCLGHMYGDPPDDAARELVRVTRPGGRIAFTSWTPTDLYPFMAGVLSTYLPPEELPDVSEPPFMWGDSDVVRSRLAEKVSSLSFETETIHYPARSPADFWQETARTSGTFIEYLESVDDADRPALRDEMIDTIRPYFDERANAVELQYLLTVAEL